MVSEKLLYCPKCGGPILYKIPSGDTRERAVCQDCATVHYQNPRLVVGTIPVWEDKILLCKRAIEPRRGFWTLPAGFMENGESTEQGAARETLEEAGARVEMQGLFSVIDVPHVEQVHLFFKTRLLDLDFAAGEESLELALFDESEIPWSDLAFHTVSNTLKWYFADRAAGSYSLHTRTLHYPPKAL